MSVKPGGGGEAVKSRGFFTPSLTTVPSLSPLSTPSYIYVGKARCTLYGPTGYVCREGGKKPVLRIRSIFFGSGSADPVEKIRIWIRILVAQKGRVRPDPDPTYMFLMLSKINNFNAIFFPNLNIRIKGVFLWIADPDPVFCRIRVTESDRIRNTGENRVLVLLHLHLHHFSTAISIVSENSTQLTYNCVIYWLID